MSIPELDANGFLPPGFHDCTLADIEAVFCYTAHRERLFAALARYFDAWLSTGLRPPIYVDGGFSTRKPEPPKDIDVVVDIEDFDLRHKPTVEVVRRLLDHDAVFAAYGIEVFPHHPLIVPNDFRLWFAYVRPEKRAALGLDDSFRKGLLRVQL